MPPQRTSSPVVVPVSPGVAESHEGDSGLHESSCKKCLVAQRITAVTIPNGVGFLADVEGLLSSTAEHQIEGLLGVAVLLTEAFAEISDRRYRSSSR
jgi:hypothetical protein